MRARSALFCFDLLELDGRDVTGLPLEERRALLAGCVEPGPVVRISHTYDDGEALLAEAARRGLEGRHDQARRLALPAGRRAAATGSSSS